MTRMIELTDLMDDNTAPVVVPVARVATTIREWFTADDEFAAGELDKMDELQAALIAKDYAQARELASELAVSFDEVQPVA